MKNLLLQNAEEVDNYLQHCRQNELNRIARKNFSYTAWHDQTDAAIIEQTFGLQKYGVKVVMMNQSADAGMPHTRGTNIICLPAYIRESEQIVKETIRHELIHIDQKRRKNIWREKLLEEEWLPDASYSVPDELIQRCRINPDTLTNPFPAWEGRYVPLPLFEREDKPNLREISVRWWDTEQERLFMQPPSSYVKKYGNQSESSMEHPYELFAYDTIDRNE